MESWIETAREAVKRSQFVRAELREEAKSMLADGEYAAAKRIFDHILEEKIPDRNYALEATCLSLLRK